MTLEPTDHVPPPKETVVFSTLVVDDNPADLEWCQIILGRTGRFPGILEASSANAAINLFVDYEQSRIAHPGLFPPALIFLDINMPGMDGFEFLERFMTMADELRGHGAIPSVILIVSSSNDERDRERAVATGMVKDFITKPLTEGVAHRIADRFGSSDPLPE